MLLGCFQFFLLFFSFSFVSSSPCPNGSLSWKSNCYIFNSTASGFAKAEMACMQIGGHLTSIHDAFTNDIIGQNAPDYFHESTVNNFWVGANSLTDPTIWEWTDGSPFDFKDWKKGEPKNVTGSNCATVSMNDGYWRAENCFKLKPFVCILSNGTAATTTFPPGTASTPTSTSTKMQSTKSSAVSSTTPSTASSTSISTKISTSSSKPSTTSTPMASNTCPSGWDYFDRTKSCYTLFPGLDWQSAEKYCQSYGAHLASIHSYEEQLFVNVYDIKYYLAVWIGLYSNDNGTTWKWTDSTPFDYVLWETGHPDIQYNEKNCAVLATTEYSGPGYFVDQLCTFANYNIVCKKGITL